MLDIINNLVLTSVLCICVKNDIEEKLSFKNIRFYMLRDKKYKKILFVKHYILPIVHTIY